MRISYRNLKVYCLIPMVSYLLMIMHITNSAHHGYAGNHFLSSNPTSFTFVYEEAQVRHNQKYGIVQPSVSTWASTIVLLMQSPKRVLPSIRIDDILDSIPGLGIIWFLQNEMDWAARENSVT